MTVKQCHVPNFCRQDSMFVCAAADNHENQKRCRFYRKATRTIRCMHYRAALEGHCDSVDAQRESLESQI